MLYFKLGGGIVLMIFFALESFSLALHSSSARVDDAFGLGRRNSDNLRTSFSGE